MDPKDILITAMRADPTATLEAIREARIAGPRLRSVESSMSYRLGLDNNLVGAIRIIGGRYNGAGEHSMHPDWSRPPRLYSGPDLDQVEAIVDADWRAAGWVLA